MVRSRRRQEHRCAEVSRAFSSSLPPFSPSARIFTKTQRLTRLLFVASLHPLRLCVNCLFKPTGDALLPRIARSGAALFLQSSASPFQAASFRPSSRFSGPRFSRFPAASHGLHFLYETLPLIKALSSSRAAFLVRCSRLGPGKPISSDELLINHLSQSALI